MYGIQSDVSYLLCCVFTFRARVDCNGLTLDTKNVGGDLHEIAEHVPAAVYGLYLKAWERVTEKKLVEEHKRQMQSLEECLHKEVMDQITPVRKLIINTMLTTSCPRCQAAFVDFEGCLAWTCGRAGCGCGFCAFCLEDYRADAHALVARCNYNTGGGLHAAQGSIKPIQTASRIAKIKEFSFIHCKPAHVNVLSTSSHRAESAAPSV